MAYPPSQSLPHHTFRAYAFLLGVFLATFSPLSAQIWSPISKTFTTQDGLPTNRVYKVMQDSRGFLWLATDKGPARFDGLNVKTFAEHSDPVFNLYEDYKGRIWFLGFDIRYEENGKLKQAPQYELIRKTIGAKPTMGFEVDSLDQLWFSLPLNSTINNQVIAQEGYQSSNITLLFKADQDTVLHYGINDILSKRRFEVPKHPIHGAFGGRSYYSFTWRNQPYLATVVNYLDRKQKGAPQWIPSMPDHSQFSPLYMVYPPQVYLISPDGTEWFVSKSEILHLHNNKVLHYHSPKEGRVFISAFEDDKGNIWLGSRNGIWQIPADHQDQLIKFDFWDGHSVTSITQDKTGSYWISTLENGISRIRSLELLQLSWPFSPAYNSIVQLLSFKQQFWWVNQGAQLYAGLPLEVPSLAFQFKEQVPPNIGILADGRLHTSYMWSFKEPYKPIPPRLAQNRIMWFRQLLNAPDGTTWMSANGSFFKYDVKTNVKSWESAFVNFQETTDALCFDQQGVLWIGGTDHLIRLKDHNIYPTHDAYPLLHQSPGRVGRISTWKDQHLIVAKYGVGIFQIAINPTISPAEHKIEAAIHHEINDFFLEGDSLLWLGTDFGIQLLAFDSSQQGWISRGFLNQGDGLSNGEIRQIAKQGGWYAAATGKGLFCFTKEDLYVPQGNDIDFQILELVTEDTTIYEPKRHISLQAGTKQFILRYIGINFRSAKSLYYRYRLLGQDSTWQYTEDHSIQYTNILPGDYQFEIQAKNKETDWTPSTVFQISLAPLFSQTLAFKILAFLLLLFICFGVAFSILRTVNRRHQMERKMNQLSYQALQSQMSPHFMFNAMNSILYLITTNQRKAAGKYLTSLARLIRRILDNSEEPFNHLQDELQRSREYLELEQLQFGEALEVEMNIAPELTHSQLLIPQLLIQPFLENAIKHGIGPLGQGKIWLSIQSQEAQILIVIEDNGIGRQAAKQIKRDDVITRTKHLGISNTSERIRNINRLFDLDIQLRIIDLVSTKGTAGTRVELLIPKINQQPHSFT